MKTEFLLPVLLVAGVLAEPVQTTLTLSPASPGKNPGINSIKIVATAYEQDMTDTTKLSGNMEVDMVIDTATDQVTDFTVTQGRANATDMRIKKSILFVGSVEADFKNLKVSLFTTDPPGVIDDLSTGEFNAEQLSFIIDEGTAKGKYNILLAGSGDFDMDFGVEPMEGEGQGKGYITVRRTGLRPGFIDYDVKLTYPVKFDQPIEGEVPMTIKADGTVEATGTVSVPHIMSYQEWVTAQGEPGAPYTGDINGDSVPNLVAWALGVEGGDSALPLMPKARNTRSYNLDLRETTTRAAVKIMVSKDLVNWSPVPLSRLSPRGTPNPLPAGFSGNVNVTNQVLGQINQLGREFIRLAVDESEAN